MPTTKQRIIEILLVIITGFGKLFFVDFLHWKLFFILLVIISWIIYIIHVANKDKRVFRYWGLTSAGASETFKWVGSFGIVAILSMLIYGFITHSILLSWHIFFVLITYPIWGIIQQFLVMSLLAGNLQDMSNKPMNKISIVLISAFMFAIVHYPSWPLILATFLMGLLYTIVFLKYRNVLVLGLFHGLAGGLFYYIILQRDPLQEIINVTTK